MSAFSALVAPVRYRRGLRIGMDLDGCNVDWLFGVYEWERRTGLTAGPYDPADFHPHRKHGMGWREYLDAVIDPGVRAGVIGYFGDPYPGAAEAWRRLRSAGHEIHVCTARGTHRIDRAADIEVTRRMLAAHGFEYDSITFSADKTVVQVDVFAEDQDDHHTALSAAGTEVWIISQPWNSHIATDRRVSSVAEFADRVEAGEVRRDLLDANWPDRRGT